MINNASQNFLLSVMIQTTSTQITSKTTNRSKPIILNLEQLHTFNDHLKIILIFTHISLLVYLHQIFQNMNQIVHIKPQFRFTSVKQYLRSTVTELVILHLRKAQDASNVTRKHPTLCLLTQINICIFFFF